LLSELLTRLEKADLRGEYTVVIAGAGAYEAPSPEDED